MFIILYYSVSMAARDRRWLWTCTPPRWPATTWVVMICWFGSTSLYRWTSPRLKCCVQVRKVWDVCFQLLRPPFFRGTWSQPPPRRHDAARDSTLSPDPGTCWHPESWFDVQQVQTVEPYLKKCSKHMTCWSVTPLIPPSALCVLVSYFCRCSRLNPLILSVIRRHVRAEDDGAGGFSLRWTGRLVNFCFICSWRVHINIRGRYYYKIKAT